MNKIRIDSPSDFKAKQKFSLKSIIELTPNQFAKLKPIHEKSFNIPHAQSPLVGECSQIARGILSNFQSGDLTIEQVKAFLRRNGFTEVADNKFERDSVSCRIYTKGKKPTKVDKDSLKNLLASIIRACFLDEINKQKQTSNQQKPGEIRKLFEKQ
jgi:hypothetical protein